MRSAARLVVSCVLFLALCPAVAPAAVRIIRPVQFRPVIQYGEPVAIIPGGIGGTSSMGYFWAPVRLPVGATLTKLSWYHYSNGSDTAVYLRRNRMGQYLPDHPESELFDGGCTVNTAGTGEAYVQEVSLPSNPESDLVVRPGYTYFILALTEDPHAQVMGVKVFFNPPAP